MDHEIPNIDELLNSFIDGELDARHQTEVQRLINHDKKIAERLLELQKCKRLVSSLPYAEAPDRMLENIKTSLKEQTSPIGPAHRVQQIHGHKGARHLLVRRLTAAAAMFGLVAVLGVVIYSILAPEPVVDTQVAVAPAMKKTEPAVIVATAEKPVEPVQRSLEFTGRLELKTSSPSEVAAFINKAIELNIPSGQSAAIGPKLKDSHVITCSRQNLRLFIDDLATIWDKFDSAKLVIQTGQPEGQIVIDAVAPEQIIETAKQAYFQSQLKTAKFFAAMNNITELSPGKEVRVAINDSAPRMITIPKPVLTSNEKPITKAAGEIEDTQKVHLTIMVVE
ncbi:MAG: hypothetical protein PHY02_01585 [Phycisphaerae bacterium]|nr:hypothetical protein [Phycisphaerae bacterium]